MPGNEVLFTFIKLSAGLNEELFESILIIPLFAASVKPK
jgi:hypothetical protein